jgi:hypothetical protein
MRRSSLATLVGVLLAAAATTQESHECTPAVCSCRALDMAASLKASHKAVRLMAVGVEEGALDNVVLDGAQTAVTASTDALSKLVFTCGQPVSFCNSTLAARRSCGCRPRRLLNITLGVQRRLDDAAAGVLFGDSEANMQTLSRTAPHTLHSLTRVGTALSELGRVCGGGGRTSSQRRAAPRLWNEQGNELQ